MFSKLVDLQISHRLSPVVGRTGNDSGTVPFFCISPFDRKTLPVCRGCGGAPNEPVKHFGHWLSSFKILISIVCTLP